MLLKNLNDYLLIDEETARTYLFNSLITGNVEEAFISSIIYVKGVKYVFWSDFRLWIVIPEPKNAYAITTKGLVKWKNPARVNEETIALTKRNLICSNYICIDLPSKNYLKINKNSIVKINKYGYKYKELDVKETNDELAINYFNDGSSVIGIKVRNKVYPLYFPSTGNKEQIIIPRGTCFRVGKVYQIDDQGKAKLELIKYKYLCYERH